MDPTRPEPTLDPCDWDAFRTASHRALDDMIDRLASVRDRPVWVETPPRVRAALRQPLPHAPSPLESVLETFRSDIAPYANGNGHPLFMGWVHGAGTPVGMIAEMLAAGLNANCGGRNHVAIDVERQITLWAAEAFGFPREASGVFVTGSSMANFLGLLVARNAALGDHVRQEGLSGARLTAYASAQAHGCVTQAMELAGIGSNLLRPIEVDAAGAMRVDDLEQAMAADRAAGLRPFLVVGTAGSVNTGAIDDLDALADVARAQNAWFHVDGAFGAMAALAPRLAPKLKGLERADSLAFDFHKWAHVPYDAGFLLVRDAEAHRRTFASSAAYLSRAPRGLAAGDVWPCDLGPDLSRGFRALKTWVALTHFGADAIGASVDHCCVIAQRLAALLAASGRFEICAPVALNIVCFSFIASHDGALNEAAVMHLHESGVAAPSITRWRGRPVIRAAIVNHRTQLADMETFVDALQSFERAQERIATASVSR